MYRINECDCSKCGNALKYECNELRAKIKNDIKRLVKSNGCKHYLPIPMEDNNETQ